MAKGFWKASRWFALALGLILALPVTLSTLSNLGRFRCRAQQSEARMALMKLFNLEKFFFSRNLRYETLEYLRTAGLQSVTGKNYTYHSAFADKNRFEIIAIGKPNTQVAQDRWSLSQAGTLKHLQNACPDE